MGKKSFVRNYYELSLDSIKFYISSISNRDSTVPGTTVNANDFKYLLRTADKSHYYPFIIVEEAEVTDQGGYSTSRSIKVYEFFSKINFLNGNKLFFPGLNFGFTLGGTRGTYAIGLSPAAALEKVNPYLNESEKAASAFQTFFTQLKDEYIDKSNKQKTELDRKKNDQKSAASQLDNILGGAKSERYKSSSSSNRSKKREASNTSGISISLVFASWVAILLPFLTMKIITWCAAADVIYLIIAALGVLGLIFDLCDENHIQPILSGAMLSGVLAGIVSIFGETSYGNIVAMIFTAIFAFVAIKRTIKRLK